MSLRNAAGAFGVCGVVATFLIPAAAQNPPAATATSQAITASTTVHGSLPTVRDADKSDWPLHNLDPSNRRYSPLDEINAANAGTLTQKWSFDAGESIAEITPLVIDGVMYFNSGSKLFAINAATGQAIWTFQLQPAFTGGGRGPAFGDGRIFAFGSSAMYAVDAKFGRLLEDFGDGGVLRALNNALEFKYPGRYPKDFDPTSIGYLMRTPPTFFDNTLYFGVALGDSHIPGGLVVAADATTGAIKWVFNTIPQGPEDDGWELAKDTWGTGARAGGGVWTPASLDPDLGLVYFTVGNPSPDYDGSARHGINLFTNSVVALNMATGRLVWHQQVVHHDIWDWDLVASPVLFDVTVAGATVKALGVPSKTCYLYIWNRETGQPLNPIVEMPVPTDTDVPGEKPWPTQPIPFTSRGVPQQPFCAVYPTVADPELAKRVRPSFQPLLANDYIIVSPGVAGGANYGGSSFSPRTSLFYVTGKNAAQSVRVKPVGDTIKPSPKVSGYFGSIEKQGDTGMTTSVAVSAYDPATGQQVWYAEVPGTTNTGNLVTGGDVVLQGIGNGDVYVFDARSGRQLFKTTVKSGVIRGSPLTYRVHGRQYLSFVGGNVVYAFGLP